MFTKALTVVFLTLITQYKVTVCFPHRHIKEIADISCSIEDAIQNANMEVANLKEKFEQDLQEGNDNINKEYQRFDEMLQESSQQCESDGKDIADCQREARDAMDSLDKSTVNLCLPKNELVKVEKSLENLENLKKGLPPCGQKKCHKNGKHGDNVGNIYRHFGKHKEDDDVQNNVQNQINEEVSSIHAGMNAAVNDFDRCVSAAIREFTDAAEKIIDDFSKCYNSD